MSRFSKLKGSVIEPANLQDLIFAKARLESIKWVKLYARHNRHPKEGEETLHSILEHLKGEVSEFDEALKFGATEARLELADISNCVDILAMLLDR